VRQAPAPVLVTPKHFTPISKALVGFDGGPHSRDALTLADLSTLVEKLAPFETWRAGKPATKLGALTDARVKELAAPELRGKIYDIISADAALTGEYEQITSVVRAVRFQRDFGRILRNFVNFSDFYNKKDGVFQTGTLYLDGRALHLCVPVTDTAKHGALAGASDACLLYCDITREGEKKQIAAALTNGDADNVFVGRNGIFYDRSGKDWDATVSKVISNPISVREAFWAPYKKLVKAIEDTVTKRAQAADAAATAKMESAGKAVGHSDTTAHAAGATAAAAPPPPNAPKKIDLGTIAAIGVAIGGIGTLLGALLRSIFGLAKWLPLRLPRAAHDDLRSVDAARVAQAPPAQPRPDPRRQRMGHQQPRTHQRLVRCRDDRARDDPSWIQALDVGSVCRQVATVAPLHVLDRSARPCRYLVRRSPRSVPTRLDPQHFGARHARAGLQAPARSSCGCCTGTGTSKVIALLWRQR